MPPETPFWDRAAYARRRPYLAARGQILAGLRELFGQQGFAEVETPALQVSPGLEVHLRAFATELNEPFGQGRRRMYLHTSPEFAMKKLLAAGEEKIFQFARVWRDGERAATHHPEFTMLEWYRKDASLDALAADCADILRVAMEAAGGGKLCWQGRTCDASFAPEVLTVAEAFDRYCGIDILATAPDPVAPDAALLRAAAKAAEIAVPDAGDWEDVFFHIFLDRIEPNLGHGRATLLAEYPVSMAALARAAPHDPRVSLRAELYVCGLELANGFDELTDAALQRARFEADMKKKQALYGEAYPIDEDFLAALAHMPAAAGMALGFDRLVMLATGAADITDVLWVPVA